LTRLITTVTYGVQESTRGPPVAWDRTQLSLQQHSIYACFRYYSAVEEDQGKTVRIADPHVKI
jgi:hypothetical protein